MPSTRSSRAAIKEEDAVKPVADLEGRANANVTAAAEKKAAKNLRDQKEQVYKDKEMVRKLNTVTGKKPNDLSEVYSPPRVAMQAAGVGLRPGWSLDLQTSDECGVPWDFDVPFMREKARRMVTEGKPQVLVGSPMCTWFCTFSRC